MRGLNWLPFSNIPQRAVQFPRVYAVNDHDIPGMNGTYYYELNHQTLTPNRPFFFAFWPVDDLVDLFVYAGMSVISEMIRGHVMNVLHLIWTLPTCGQLLYIRLKSMTKILLTSHRLSGPCIIPLLGCIAGLILKLARIR